jgi:hypothetical protein
MSFLSVLKAIGKDLGHVGTWIDDGLKVAQQVAAVADPPLVPIITAIENTIEGIQSAGSQPISAATVQAIVTAVATLEGIKAATPPITPGLNPAVTATTP